MIRRRFFIKINKGPSNFIECPFRVNRQMSPILMNDTFFNANESKIKVYVLSYDRLPSNGILDYSKAEEITLKNGIWFSMPSKYVNKNNFILFNIDKSVSSLNNAFNGILTLPQFSFSNFDLSGIKEMQYMFSNSNITSINLDMSKLTSIEKMTGIFEECHSLTKVDFIEGGSSTLSWFNNIFNKCDKLQTVSNMGGNYPSLNRIDYLFNGCSSIASNITLGITANVVRNIDSICSASSIVNFNMRGIDFRSIQSAKNSFSSWKLTGLTVDGHPQYLIDTPNKGNFVGMFPSTTTMGAPNKDIKVYGVGGQSSSISRNKWNTFLSANRFRATAR